MEALTYEALATESTRYDACVSRTSDIDRFCSSSFWILPAARHLMPPSSPFVFRTGDGYVALMRISVGGKWTLIQPLEACWGLPCPLVGPEPDTVVEAFVELCTAHNHWDAALVTGLPAEARLSRKLAAALGSRFAVQKGPSTSRYLADLRDGVDGFLKRRSPELRRNLRRAERRAATRGVSFEVVDDGVAASADADFERLLKVERRSWKGRSGAGINREPACSFYREIHRRLVERGLRRMVFARLDGEDVAYILGGVVGTTYRGLQFSFDETLSDLSLGNLCQLHEVRRLTEAGVETYDLGTEVPYKKRWGERTFTTDSILIQR